MPPEEPADAGGPYADLLRLIDQTRIARGIPSERKMCVDAGVGLKTVSHMRKRGHAPKPVTLTKLAKFLNLPPGQLLDLAARAARDHSESATTERVFVIAAVQAGVWQPAMEWDADDRYAVDVPGDSRFPGAERFGLVVKGTSMDRLYPEGTIVIAIRFSDLPTAPEPGNRVVVLRRDRRSGDFEATLKEYQRDQQGRHILWPRSNDPEFQTPFVLTGQVPLSLGDETIPPEVNAGPLDQTSAPDLQIFALVVGSYRPE